MRKNKLMRAAAGLMVATLLTTSIISGTLAKYTTSVESSDEARVATWGFKESSIDLTGLFNTTYTNVNSNNGKVIAPGTDGKKSFNFTYEGQEAKPEVAYKFTVGIDDTGIAADIKSNPNIKWALLDGTGVDTSTATWGDWDALVASVKKLSGDPTGTKEYAANELPTAFSQKNTNTHTIAWKWDFEGTGTEEAKKTQDTKDTALGNKDALDKVNVKITITATQID